MALYEPVPCPLSLPSSSSATDSCFLHSCSEQKFRHSLFGSSAACSPAASPSPRLSLFGPPRIINRMTGTPNVTTSIKCKIQPPLLPAESPWSLGFGPLCDQQPASSTGLRRSKRKVEPACWRHRCLRKLQVSPPFFCRRQTSGLQWVDGAVYVAARPPILKPPRLSLHLFSRCLLHHRTMWQTCDVVSAVSSLRIWPR